MNYHPALYTHLQPISSTRPPSGRLSQYITSADIFDHHPTTHTLYTVNFSTSQDEEVCTNPYSFVSIKHIYIYTYILYFLLFSHCNFCILYLWSDCCSNKLQREPRQIPSSNKGSTIVVIFFIHFLNFVINGKT